MTSFDSSGSESESSEPGDWVAGTEESAVFICVNFHNAVYIISATSVRQWGEQRDFPLFNSGATQFCTTPCSIVEPCSNKTLTKSSVITGKHSTIQENDETLSTCIIFQCRCSLLCAATRKSSLASRNKFGWLWFVRNVVYTLDIVKIGSNLATFSSACYLFSFVISTLNPMSN